MDIRMSGSMAVGSLLLTMPSRRKRRRTRMRRGRKIVRATPMSRTPEVVRTRFRVSPFSSER